MLLCLLFIGFSALSIYNCILNDRIIKVQVSYRVAKAALQGTFTHLRNSH